MMQRVILTKKHAASWLGITQQTLSGYLRDARIEEHSIIGEGVRARIDINQAVTDLRKNLDPEQRECGNSTVRLRFYPQPKAES
jgi:hypothetical protein